MSEWEWPQYLFAVAYALNVLLQSWLHGQPRKDKYSGPQAIIMSALGIWILYMGGFWS